METTLEAAITRLRATDYHFGIAGRSEAREPSGGDPTFTTEA
jgi:hypothetical protein